MTAAELYEVVKDVPREAWPSMVVFVANMWAFETKAYPTGTKSYFMPTDVAEHAFIGSMTAWLLRQEWRGLGRGHLLIDELDDGDVAIDMQYVELDGITETYRICDMHASSLVAALAAACKEAA